MYSISLPYISPLNSLTIYMSGKRWRRNLVAFSDKNMHYYRGECDLHWTHLEASFMSKRGFIRVESSLARTRALKSFKINVTNVTT